MRIGVVGDTHLGCTDYSVKRRADFSAAFCNAIDLCQANGAAAICLLGDVFDSAATRRNVDAFAATLGEISPHLLRLKEARIPLIAIPGNHEFGRGREAGELKALEYLGFVHVLRSQEFDLGPIRICGIPWQQDSTQIARLAESLSRSSRAGPQVLLLHNFVRGARLIPEELWQVDPGCLAAFDKVFVGHHHVFETLGNCVMPGSTEVQNVLDLSEKCIVMYDTEGKTIERLSLPKTHRVVVLVYDLTALTTEDLIAALARDLDAESGVADAFVYVRITGTLRTKNAPSKVELISRIREREAFDYYVDFRYSTEAQTAAAATRGASIDQVLRRTFRGRDLAKAQQYLRVKTSDELFNDIREMILSDHQEPRTR